MLKKPVFFTYYGLTLILIGILFFQNYQRNQNLLRMQHANAVLTAARVGINDAVWNKMKTIELLRYESKNSGWLKKDTDRLRRIAKLLEEMDEFAKHESERTATAIAGQAVGAAFFNWKLGGGHSYPMELSEKRTEFYTILDSMLLSEELVFSEQEKTRFRTNSSPPQLHIPTLEYQHIVQQGGLTDWCTFSLFLEVYITKMKGYYSKKVSKKSATPFFSLDFYCSTPGKKVQGIVYIQHQVESDSLKMFVDKKEIPVIKGRGYWVIPKDYSMKKSPKVEISIYNLFTGKINVFSSSCHLIYCAEEH